MHFNSSLADHLHLLYDSFDRPEDKALLGSNLSAGAVLEAEGNAAMLCSFLSSALSAKRKIQPHIISPHRTIRSPHQFHPDTAFQTIPRSVCSLSL
jgi:hypothetical protein